MPASATPERLVEDLVAAHRHVAVLAAHDVLRDWALAEDAAQLAFAVILNRLRCGDTGLLDTRPEATVRRNARWAAMKIRRARLRVAAAEDRCGRLAPADDAGPWSSAEAAAVCEAILASLPEHYSEAIRLRFFQQLPDAVAAARLQVTLRAYRRRLDRALVQARTAAGDLGLRGVAALVAVRRSLLRRLGDLGTAWGTPIATTTALAVIMAAPAGPAMAGAARGPATHGGAPAVVATGEAAARVTSVSAGRGGALRAVPQLLGSLPVPTALRRAGTTAAEETPEDTSFYSAAAVPAAGGGGGGAVVAAGWGHSCTCSVVFESRDGWHTWRAAAGPDLAAGTRMQVALPPAYPDDPRIFMGSPLGLGGAVDMLASGFGAPFLPLGVTGDITVPPSFEQDSTVFVATAGGMDRFTLGATTGKPVVFVPPVMAPDVLAAPATGTTYTYALAEGSIASTQIGDGTVGYSITTTGIPQLYRCADTGQCSRVANSPTPAVGGLAVSPRYALDSALAISGAQGAVYLSTDAGKTFTQLPDPGGAVEQALVASAAGAVTVWAVVSRPPLATVLRWDGSRGWQAASPTGWQPRAGTAPQLVALGAGRAVVFDDRDGARCTADGGLTWAEVCPA